MSDNTEPEEVAQNEDELSWEIEENLTPEELAERWKEIFKDMQDKGILVPDKDAPACMTCGENLNNIDVKIVWTVGGPDEEFVIDEQNFEWAKGLHQYVASPGFFKFVDEDMGRFEAECSLCHGPVIDLISTDNPHGLLYGDMARMAGKL